MTDTMPLAPAERRLRTLLTVLVPLFLIAALIYQFGPIVGPFRGFFRHLPFVSNSVVKVSVIMLCCLYAAGDLRRRHGLVLVVILAHLVSVGAMGLLLLLADTGRVVDVGSFRLPARNVLWGAIALDGVITAALIAAYLDARRAARALGLRPAPAAPTPAPADRRFRTLMQVLGALFVLAAAAYEAGPLLAATRELFVELPFVTNSVVKVSALALLCFYVARDVPGRLPVAGIVVTGHVVSLVAMLPFFVLIPSRTAAMVTVGGAQWSVASILGAAMALDGVILAVLLLAYQAAWRARLGSRFLGVWEFRALSALADVVVAGEDERVPPERVAANLDRYVAPIRARRRWVYRAALVAIQAHPLLYLKAPFSELDADTRLAHVKRHFRRDVLLGVIPDWWRRLVQIVIRVGKQLVYVGYYADPATFASIGYRPFSERLRVAGRPVPPKSPTTLDVIRPEALASDVLDTDVCVIGSGAAGAILAYRLAERGRSVLVVERGKYVPPAQFTEDEVDMIGKVYADGVFQQTEDFRFTILQGSCVGGSTVINNAVCFDPPQRVVKHWNAAPNDAGLDASALAQSVVAVRDLIDVNRQTHNRLNPSGALFEDQARRPPAVPGTALEVGVVEANVRDCLGCGYCNIGCAYGRKLSMLDRVLPEAQGFEGRVRIVAECAVTRLRVRSGTPPRILDARAELPDGRRITIRAQTFVVAAGAIASSYLLLRSGIGRDLPVGRRMSFNMGSPVTAEFPDVLNAHDGLQISHYGLPDPGRGFVLETWWNPPVAQAINMPGWFEDHFANMRSYPRLMAVGVLVGTAANARVRAALTGGPAVVYTPEDEDLRKLGDGLAQTADLLLQAGARRVMLNTWGYDSFAHPSQLADIHRFVRDPRYITLGTGHPQGGNAISRNPALGVVDERFRVHGYENLYVCDASVFPSSITVNPQLTVMALADYAAARVA
jgi:choline dehydrogenase-like flavoprotein